MTPRPDRSWILWTLFLATIWLLALIDSRWGDGRRTDAEARAAAAGAVADSALAVARRHERTLNATRDSLAAARALATARIGAHDRATAGTDRAAAGLQQQLRQASAALADTTATAARLRLELAALADAARGVADSLARERVTLREERAARDAALRLAESALAEQTARADALARAEAARRAELEAVRRGSRPPALVRWLCTGGEILLTGAGAGVGATLGGVQGAVAGGTGGYAAGRLVLRGCR